MTDNFERAKSRLENIKAIEPLLSALRTISMGTWQAALNKLSQIKEFEEESFSILREIIPEINLAHNPKNLKKIPENNKSIILILGTERGLCGKFNQNLAKNVLLWIKQQQLSSYQIWVMGKRMIREFERQGVPVAWQYSLPAGTLLDYKETYFLTQKWVAQYESFEFNRLIIMYNQPTKGNLYRFQTTTLLPYEFHSPLSSQNGEKGTWPPSIVETSEKMIFQQIIQHLLSVNLYRALLESAAAEHSSRFNMMEDAKDNADDIMLELNQVINTERKKKITKEMQELASGSGLLDKKKNG